MLDQRDKLLLYAMHLCRNKEDSEDLLQDTYLKALTGKLKHGNVRAWLKAIMRNLFITRYRHQQSFKVIRIGDSVIFENWLQKYPSPEVSMWLSECMEQISAMNETNKKTFLLNIEGYSYKEIAEIENQSVQTIKMRLHRARKRLKEYAN